MKVVVSDQGCEFVNKLSEHLYHLTNTHHRISTAYHPQTNGLVERFNQTLQRALLKLGILGCTMVVLGCTMVVLSCTMVVYWVVQCRVLL